jgi:Ca-activated chloride channel homolog
VLLADSGEAIARRFYDRIASPVLTDVRVAFEGLDVVDVEPQALADVWDQRPLVIHARYRKAGSGTIVLRGFQQGRPYEQRLAVTLPEREAAHAAIASLWARARVESIMNEDLAAAQRNAVPVERRERIVTIALAHRLLTPFTSFVAVEERIVNEGGRQRTVPVPVEMPDGVRYDGIFGGKGEGAADVAAPRAFGGLAETEGAPGIYDLAAAPRQVPDGHALEKRARRAEVDATGSAEPSHPNASAPPPPSPRAQTRLAPELLALAATPATTPPARVRVEHGRVRVAITLRTLGDGERRAVLAAGVTIDRVDGTTIVGWIAVEKLMALAEVDGVERVTPATT